MDAIIEYASTPEGMLIVVGVAFIGIVLLLTALIFWIGSLLRRRGVKIDQTPDTDDETADSSPSADESASQDPLAAFDREAAEQSARAASKAPIALARLRAAGPDITAAAEPKLPEPVLEQNPSVQSAAAPESAPAVSAYAAEVQPPMPAAAAPAFWESPAKLQPKAPDPLAGTRFLLTLPFERRSGLSMAHADLCGIGVEAVFFDPEPVSRLDEDAVRLVPFLPANAAKLLLTESDRETFKAGALCAQPDAVLELPAGLIALEYKSKGGRFDDPLRWAETMRTKDLIQTVLAAAALSVAAGRPAAPVLRTTNAVFFLRPTNELKNLLSAHVQEAESFLLSTSEGAGRPGISASDYASLMIPALEKLYPREPSSGSEAGEAAHQEMLRTR